MIFTIIYKEHFVTENQGLGETLFFHGFICAAFGSCIGFACGFVIASFKARFIMWLSNRRAKQIINELRVGAIYEMSKDI